MSRQSHRQFLQPTLAVRDDDVVAALALARRRFEATFEHAPVGMAHVALDGSFLLVNPRFCEISGHDAATLMRTGFQRITHPDDLNLDEALLARLHAGEIPRYSLEKRYVRADGSIIWVNLTVAMVRDQAGAPEFFIGVIEDLSDLRRANFEAMHDPLTGLLNRRGLACRAKDVFAQAARPGGTASLMFIDLDGFKQLNDSRGHAAGDACLVEVAGILEGQVGAQDAVARIGGDEFVILSANLDARAAIASGERLRGALDASRVGVSGSFGLVAAAAGPFDLDALIDRADGAMLAAKRAGKNRIILG